jgi:muconolactone delta-isomerase
MTMGRRSTTIASRLHSAQRLILTTSRNDEIRALVAAQGYRDNDIAEGQALYDAAVKAVQLQAAKAGGQRAATDQARLAERAARAAYQNLACAVRAMFGPNTPERKALQVNGIVPTTSAAFLAAATTLFDNALNLEDIGAKLARRGFDKPALQRGRAALTHYQEQLQAQASARSNALRATAAQRAALTALHRWVGEYSAFATIALRERPDLLRELGITPRRKATTPVPTP